jgi:hypothetical protein
MSDDKVFRDCIEATLQAIGVALAERGFPGEPSIVSASSDKLHRWIRRTSWRTEIVQASHKQRTARSIELSLAVEIPCRDGAGVLLDGQSVESILDRGQLGWLPQIFTSARCPGYSRSMVDAVIRALSWFDRFATPAAALEQLRSGQTNHGQVRGKAYQELEEFLQRATTGEI